MTGQRTRAIPVDVLAGAGTDPVALRTWVEIVRPAARWEGLALNGEPTPTAWVTLRWGSAPSRAYEVIFDDPDLLGLAPRPGGPDVPARGTALLRRWSSAVRAVTIPLSKRWTRLDQEQLEAAIYGDVLRRVTRRAYSPGAAGRVLGAVATARWGLALERPDPVTWAVDDALTELARWVGAAPSGIEIEASAELLIEVAAWRRRGDLLDLLGPHGESVAARMAAGGSSVVPLRSTRGPVTWRRAARGPAFAVVSDALMALLLRPWSQGILGGGA